MRRALVSLVLGFAACAPVTGISDTEPPDAVAPDAVSDALGVDSARPDACTGVVCRRACVDLMTDPENCGACNVRCDALPNVRSGAGRCIEGQCRIDDGCRVGYANCNGSEPGGGLIDGCESEIIRPARCGDCATQCSGSQVCREVPDDRPDASVSTRFVCR